MLQEESIKLKWPLLVVARSKDYMQMLKPNLSGMVVFSSVIGYLLAPGISFDWLYVMALFVGGMLVTGSANVINQILERRTDALMHRTQRRPLPDGRMQVPEAVLVAVISGLAGTALITWFFNPLAGALSVLSLVLYGFAYTPMKRINPISVLIGAFPGAMPPLIGWAAATGSLSAGGWVLFLIQFFWQFPHYWAIAWVCFEDYGRAGLKMLPSYAGKTRFTGMQCFFYSLVLVPLSLLPYLLGMTGWISMIVLLICAVGNVLASFDFYRKNNHQTAKRVMYASFIYLPVVLLALWIDKI